MDLDLSYIPEQDIVGAEIAGETTLRDVQRAAVDGLRLAKENLCHSYLIDISRAVFKYFDNVTFKDPNGLGSFSSVIYENEYGYQDV
jgi:hypothetical protein